MTGPIDINHSQKPFVGQPHDEVNPRQQPEKARENRDDRVSLGEQESVDQTYGPGLKVASPYELLRNLVVKTLQEQGLELQFKTDSGDVNFNTMTQEEAQDLISEDGYFGVEKTSQRIVDFAINGFGNDPEKLQEMKDAIGQGFKDAQEAFGGALPEISKQTYEAIMDKLDAFADQFNQAGE